MFLREATQELLYNIVCETNNNDEGIEFRELSEKFQGEYRYRPMDFFGHGNGTGWVKFLKSSPGLHFETMVSIGEDVKGKLYEMYHKEKVEKSINISVAKYRQILIHKACDLISQQTDVASSCKQVNDVHGNTPLHLVAAMPCIDHESTMLNHLLDAGFNPLQTNNDGQTILHIIAAGRIQAEVCKEADGNVDCASFANSTFCSSTWPGNYRITLLRLLIAKLTSGQLTVLANLPSKDGNTAMHEWVISLSKITSNGLQLGYDQTEKEIGDILLRFGANLRLQNNSGETPLHFAFNSEIFQFLLENSTQKTVVCCRARNERDETPLLFILKYAMKLATDFDAEEKNMTALLVLKQLTDLVDKNKEVCKTAWLPDEDGNSAVNILLKALRNTSHRTSEPGRLATFFGNLFSSASQVKKNGKFDKLRGDLISLLEKSLNVASEYDLNRGSLLHALIDLGDEQSLRFIDIVLKRNADVNAIDSKGRTPLDVIRECKSKMVSNPFFTKCEKKILYYGAKSELYSSTHQETTSPNVDNKRRKLRNCPEKYTSVAQQLIQNYDKVTVVDGKYRYSSREPPIGFGAFSSVFVTVKDENEDKQSGTIDCRVYALKRIEKAKINHQEIEREIRSLLTVAKSEYIITYHESFEDDIFHYICLDLMDGDLNEFVMSSNRELDPVTEMQITEEIVNGLKYLHEQDFIHCDLKPGNILYTTNPLHFKIADFGLSRNVSPFTLSTVMSTSRSGVAMAGTRCWMAPELINMESTEHTKYSDLFSLGLVLYFLLTRGKHPFARSIGEQLHVIEKRIANVDYIDQELHPKLHPEAISFLKVLLAKDPQKRLPAKYLIQQPFLWPEEKKIDFLIAVGKQPETLNPNPTPLEECLQEKSIGESVERKAWDQLDLIKDIFEEMTKGRTYRTNKVIDLLRFIRNAYVHRQERSPYVQSCLDRNPFLCAYPFLVLDVFDVVQDLGFVDDKNRTDIQKVLTVKA